ncbi:MAG: penicillin-insensitive murein endopeptidase [Paracoccus sp. (in: a-proteobacteria)]
MRQRRSLTAPALLTVFTALFLVACGSSRDDLSYETAGVAVARDNTTPAKTLFGSTGSPSGGTAAAFGGYSKGCIAGAVALPETGATWQAMRLSRNRNWGSPQLISFLERLSVKQARQPGWSGIYVGDLSQPRGGPMLTGHASHQIGLDADVWLLTAQNLNLTAAQRESISSSDLSRRNGTSVNSGWTAQHMALVKAAAEDPAVARIFIFPGAKVKMCAEATGDRTWLRKVRPWYGHRAHMHVRLACPSGMRGCVDQDPPPAGDGCAEAQQWVSNILNPPPPDPNAPKPPPKRELTLADLPAQCSALVSR